MKAFQWIMAVCFVVVLALGWKYSILGLMVIPMIGSGMIFALINGRWFCGNICPRGQFLERLFSKVSSSKDIPRVFIQPIFRWTFLIIFMGKMSYSLVDVYQDGFTVDALASAFWWSMFGSSVIAFVGALFYNSRFWCAVCPVGTIGKSVKGIAPANYRVDSSCKDCGACTRACPFNHKPSDYKGSEFDNSDCIKCGKCVDACKFGAIKK